MRTAPARAHCPARISCGRLAALTSRRAKALADARARACAQIADLAHLVASSTCWDSWDWSEHREAPLRAYLERMRTLRKCGPQPKLHSGPHSGGSGGVPSSEPPPGVRPQPPPPRGLPKEPPPRLAKRWPAFVADGTSQLGVRYELRCARLPAGVCESLLSGCGGLRSMRMVECWQGGALMAVHGEDTRALVQALQPGAAPGAPPGAAPGADAVRVTVDARGACEPAALWRVLSMLRTTVQAALNESGGFSMTSCSCARRASRLQTAARQRARGI